MFPCATDVSRSFYKPSSVHQLRPGDIEVVAALGDGNVAAKGALSRDVRDVGRQHRGVSFATGISIKMLHKSNVY